MIIQMQQPDWQKLYLQGSCKFANQPWTDEEVKMINKNWTWDMNVVKQLRADYLRENEAEFTDPKGKATQPETTPVTTELTHAIESTKPIMVNHVEIWESSTSEGSPAPTTANPLVEKVAEYTNLYGKEPTGKRAKDEVWLDKKIAEAKAK